VDFSATKAEIENGFHEECRKGAKFAARAAFWAILGEISCLFSLALEFFTRFRGGSFQPLTHLSGKQLSVVSLQSPAKAPTQSSVVSRRSSGKPSLQSQKLATILAAIAEKALQHLRATAGQDASFDLHVMIQLRVVQHLHD
jgi:hypothetical protein